MSLTSLPEDILLEVEGYIALDDDGIPPYYRDQHSLAQTCRGLHQIFRRVLLKHYLLYLDKHTQRLLFNMNLQSLSPQEVLAGSLPHLAIIKVGTSVTHGDIFGIGYVLAYLGSSLQSVSISLDGTDRKDLAHLLDTVVWIPGLKLEVHEEGSYAARSYLQSKGLPRFRPFRIERQKLPFRHEGEGSFTQENPSSMKWLFGSLWKKKQTRRKYHHEISFEDSVLAEYRRTATPQMPAFYVSIPSNDHAQFTSFSIDGETLFTSSMLPWTSRILATAPLVSLTLGKINWIRPDEWAEIMRMIDIPTLKILIIGSIDIYFHDVLKLLHRHALIELLDISETAPLGGSNITQYISRSDLQRTSRPLLHNLSTLIASPPFLVSFLLRLCKSDNYAIANSRGEEGIMDGSQEIEYKEFFPNLNTIHFRHDKTLSSPLHFEEGQEPLDNLILSYCRQFWYAYDILASDDFGGKQPHIRRGDRMRRAREGGLHLSLPSLTANGLLEWMLGDYPVHLSYRHMSWQSSAHPSIHLAFSMSTASGGSNHGDFKSESLGRLKASDVEDVRKLRGIHKLSLMDESLKAPPALVMRLRSRAMRNEDLWQAMWSSSSPPAVSSVDEDVLIEKFLRFALPDLETLEFAK